MVKTTTNGRISSLQVAYYHKKSMRHGDEGARMEYLPRLADKALDGKLQYAGAVCIRGPKWCGKTSTAEQRARSAIYLQDPDELENHLTLAQTKPSLLLQGDKPRLIDEWQDAPQLWDAVRFAVDRGQETGAYILTGSAVPGKKPRHSGTGRFSYLDMRPMTLFESRDSTGDVALSRLFEEGYEPEGASRADIEDIAYLVCRGGWPRAVTIGGIRRSTSRRTTWPRSARRTSPAWTA